MRRSNRIAHLIQKVVGEHLISSEVDERIYGASITEVKMSSDLKTATLYNQIPSTWKGDKAEFMRIFSRSAKPMRQHLARMAELKRVPALRFVYDETLDNAERIYSIMTEHKDNEN